MKRDMNQDIATGETPQEEPVPEQSFYVEVMPQKFIRLENQHQLNYLQMTPGMMQLQMQLQHQSQ